MDNSVKNTATLLINCPDQKGLVASISNFIYQFNGNIISSDQHQDAEKGVFLMRIEWDLAGWNIERKDFEGAFKPIANKFNMNWRIAYSDDIPKIAIFVSKFDHCLSDLLYRHKLGESNCKIPLIISNHPDTRALAEFYQIPFFLVPMDLEHKQKTEELQLKLLKEHQIDLVVLARYMQILSPDFVQAYCHRIINIHHSFLPAFLGAKPYHQAFERGVKLIGATSHYVTEDLDDGPIIHQDVIQISHRDQIKDLVQKGRDLERLVLSRAVTWHLENRVIIYGKRTVIFD